MGNKVKYGLSNVHWAPVIQDAPAAIVYGLVKPWPGAVNISLEAQGDPVRFRADNGVYWGYATNDGYSGDLEMAEIPDEFRTDCLGEEIINGVAFESGEPKPEHLKKFALFYQFEGDARATKHVNYYCSVSRPTDESGTVSDSIEPQTSTVTITSEKRPDTKMVKARCTTAAPQETYDSWFDYVHEKPAEVPATGVTVSPSAATLGVGESMQLSAIVAPANASIKSATYGSSDEAIATVDALGKVTTVAAGTATITATPVGGGSVDTCTVTVV
jgi:phi13 family phage major tail protein